MPARKSSKHTETKNFTIALKQNGNVEREWIGSDSSETVSAIGAARWDIITNKLHV